MVAVALLSVALSACMPADAQTFLTRTNAVRSTEGVRLLVEHPVLTNKAESWARHMASTGVLSHSNVTSGLGTLNWTVLGENVGVSGSTVNPLLYIHNAFMNSPLHRANIVDPRFTHMGVGVAKDSRGRTWVVEVFARVV